MSTHVLLFVRRELAAALHARWFVTYSAVFLGGGLLLATVGLNDVTVYGYRGFAKAFAGLTHLALLLVPVMALFPAAAAIAEDRESGALEYVLAQPVTHREVYLGKLFGVSLAVVLSITVGFGLSGALAVLRGVPAGLVVALLGFVILLAASFSALGICFSTLTGSRARAMTAGVIVWLGLVVFGTLGIVVAFIRWGIPEQVLVTWAFVNPIEAFRLGIVSALDPDLSLLGPLGATIVRRLGTDGTMGVCAAALATWALAPGLLGYWAFRRTTA